MRRGGRRSSTRTARRPPPSSSGLGERDDLYAALIEFMDVMLVLAANRDFSSLALAIAAEAGREPAIAMRVERNDGELRAELQALLTEAAARGQVDAMLDIAETATWIAALIDGIFSRAAGEAEVEADNQHETMRILLGRLLLPEMDVSNEGKGA